MRIYVSAAVTTDGYLDDNSPERLVISTPEDWAEVYKLRSRHDAIMVGVETLRRDNPSLRIRDEAVRRQRETQGLPPDIARVTMTKSGNIASDINFFTSGKSSHYIFSPRPLPELDSIAEVISADGPVTARFIVTELEKRGIEHLLVEGGAQTLKIFFDEGMVDTFRLAVNTAMRLSAERGGAKLEIGSGYLAAPHTCERLGGMEVTTSVLHPDTSAEDLHYLRAAIEQSRRCTPSATSYCVGVVVRTSDGRIFTGYTHETSPTHHAEQEAITKAATAGAEMRGATIYSSMEPCSQRNSEPESCSELIIRQGFARVIFALYEPSHFVCCRGALNLRSRGIEVRAYISLAEEVRKVNGHLWA